MNYLNECLMKRREKGKYMNSCIVEYNNNDLTENLCLNVFGFELILVNNNT